METSVVSAIEGQPAAAAEATPEPTSENSALAASTSNQPLSKNAQKRLARTARIQEQKKERRAAEKERKKERKRQEAQKRAAGELEDEQEGSQRKKQRVDEYAGPRTPFGARIVVDLGFDSMMTENEVKSLTSQLAFTYSANRKAVRPFSSLLFTSLNGRTFTRLEGINNAAYKRWADTEWWTESYEKLWEEEKGEGSIPTTADESAGTEERNSVTPQPTNSQQDSAVVDGSANASSTQKRRAFALRESVIYLTADSAEELTELKEHETYIIGGICDHNRYKNLCLNKSRDTKVRSARLPIGTYLSELKTRKVLTVNQTVEILLKWVETRDWEKALWAVIPRRKFNEQGRKGKRGAKSEDGEESADEEGEGEAEQVVISASAVEQEDEGADVGYKEVQMETEETAKDATVTTLTATELAPAGSSQ
ncbi:hypothetical protein OBBRIDRAFT_769613 [Obba rivulosa]|uniref:tRNA (guanine(9)-N1)-methyltransferase n=1 Tax=Obba rivulosa TaxID=1052685 RepID=A0A8E2DRK8_9APHY|nr:hypothetical protein OBBRIDRAFT_769613 [Obba rivulosa]